MPSSHLYFAENYEESKNFLGINPRGKKQTRFSEHKGKDKGNEFSKSTLFRMLPKFIGR